MKNSKTKMKPESKGGKVTKKENMQFMDFATSKEKEILEINEEHPLMKRKQTLIKTEIKLRMKMARIIACMELNASLAGKISKTVQKRMDELKNISQEELMDIYMGLIKQL